MRKLKTSWLCNGMKFEPQSEEYFLNGFACYSVRVTKQNRFEAMLSVTSQQTREGVENQYYHTIYLR